MDQEIDLFSLKPKKQIELTVSEFSQQIKLLVEKNFNNIRLKGEISGFKIAPSGHAYFSLKDKNSILSAVCWKGNIAKLKCKPEEGLEVVCSGSITAYPGQSKYQIIVSSMEASGVGALMAMLEKRKKQFIAEGLFATDHKKKLPNFPQKIGVVTSITGSVIRDIIHRISDRFPLNILIWPVLVQGNESSEQVTAAINGFNNMDQSKKPDLIILARGGGSIEDLWSFNEENVVRAIFNSSIPIISAIGHETDYTLSDFVADVRAPTPTAAAEMAVPVKQDLFLTLSEYKFRLINILRKKVQQAVLDISQLGSLKEKLQKSILEREQRIDDLQYKLDLAMKNYISHKKSQAEILHSRVTHPSKYLLILENKLKSYYDKFFGLIKDKFQQKEKSFLQYKYSLNTNHAVSLMHHNLKHLEVTISNFHNAISTKLSEKELLFKTTYSILDSLDYQKTLNRGFSVVKKSKDNKIVMSVNEFDQGETYLLEVKDGKKDIKII